jgi:hypothetical protein
MRFFKSYFALTLFAAIQAFATPQDEMTQDFNVIRYHVSFRYALKEWKENSFGWNLEDACKKAKKEIGFSLTTKEYQKVVKNFFNSFKDYHAKCCFSSSEMSYFPLKVVSAENRYFLLIAEPPSGLSQEELPFLMSGVTNNMSTLEAFDKLKFENGEELLEVNGKNIKQVIHQIIDEELGGDRTPTGLALAEKLLFFRRGKYAQKCPQGELTLKVKKKNGKTETYKTSWIYVKEAVPYRFFEKQSQKGEFNFLLRDFSSPFARDFSESYTTPEDSRKKGFLPPLGEVLAETDKNDREGLYAYLYKHPKTGKKVGYITIPTFTFLDETAAKAWIDNYLSVIQFFEQEAEALVVDITNNPGGNGMFCYATLSGLADKPLKPLLQQETINQQEVYKAAAKVKLEELFPAGETPVEFFGFPVSLKTRASILNHSKELVKSLERGELLTDPLYLMGIDEIPPHPRGHFTKPVLVLINELCFSCGDLFPAILQDNKRAKIFGKRTAGAGGYVRMFEHASLFGIERYSLTGSVIYRENGDVIENGGVQPDIQYNITVEDVKSGFKGYIKAVNDSLFN